MRPRRLAIKVLDGFLKIVDFGSGYAGLGFLGGHFKIDEGPHRLRGNSTDRLNQILHLILPPDSLRF
jgi:hypothetical protein